MERVNEGRGSLGVKPFAGDWVRGSVPGPSPTWAGEPPGSADHYSLKGREYFIIMSIAFRALAPRRRYSNCFTHIPSVFATML